MERVNVILTRDRVVGGVKYSAGHRIGVIELGEGFPAERANLCLLTGELRFDVETVADEPPAPPADPGEAGDPAAGDQEPAGAKSQKRGKGSAGEAAE